METSCDMYVRPPKGPMLANNAQKCRYNTAFLYYFSVSLGGQGNESDENSLNLAEYTAKIEKRKGKSKKRKLCNR
jgi:hypothetical protein